MFTIKGCSLIRGVHYERFHCSTKIVHYKFCECYKEKHKLTPINLRLNMLEHTNLRISEHIYCELSTNPCSIFVYSLGPWTIILLSPVSRITELMQSTFSVTHH